MSWNLHYQGSQTPRLLEKTVDVHCVTVDFHTAETPESKKPQPRIGRTTAYLSTLASHRFDQQFIRGSSENSRGLYELKCILSAGVLCLYVFSLPGRSFAFCLVLQNFRGEHEIRIFVVISSERIQFLKTCSFSCNFQRKSEYSSAIGSSLFRSERLAAGIR